jgi:hypothetical protein
MSIEQQRARRYERKRNELSRIGPVRCGFCGEPDARCIEGHHVLGSANAADTMLLCRNCHSKMSDRQQDLPEGFLSHNTELSSAEGMAGMLLSIADLIEEFFRFVVEQLRKLAQRLQSGGEQYATA